MSISRLILVFMLLVSSLAFAGDEAQPSATAASLDLNAHAGQVVYVDFWASWCPPCRASFPWMQSLQDRFAERGLVVITVNVDKERKAAEKFLATMKTTLPIVWDAEGELAKKYELQAMPTSFIYDRQGKLVSSHVGFDPDKKMDVENELINLLSAEVDAVGD